MNKTYMRKYMRDWRAKRRAAGLPTQSRNAKPTKRRRVEPKPAMKVLTRPKVKIAAAPTEAQWPSTPAHWADAYLILWSNNGEPYWGQAASDDLADDPPMMKAGARLARTTWEAQQSDARTAAATASDLRVLERQNLRRARARWRAAAKNAEFHSTTSSGPGI